MNTLLNIDVVNDIVGIADCGMGYIYKYNNKYVVEYCDRTNDVRRIGTFNEPPTKFISATNVVQRNVSHVFNHAYCVRDNNVCEIPGTSEYNDYGQHITEDYRILNINCDHKIIVDTRYKPNAIRSASITGIHDNYHVYKIGKSYYHAEDLTQYSNTSYNIVWTPGNHKYYDGYTRKLIHFVIMCHKHSVIQKMVPRVILYCIIQFIL